MAATVNPCGFALLPAYLSAFLGDQHRHGGANAVGRALSVSAALTAGFVVVFGLFGIIVTPLALSVDDKLPWVTIVIGSALVVAAIALLARTQRNVRIPKMRARRSWASAVDLGRGAHPDDAVALRGRRSGRGGVPQLVDVAVAAVETAVGLGPVGVVTVE